MGEIVVRLSLDKKTGSYEAKVLRHEGDSACGDDIDAEIIQDLLDAEIPEFGHMLQHGDSGHTSEYFEEKAAKQKSCKYRYNDIDNDEGDDEGGKTNKSKKVELGYGV